jgi:hypothetical protein
MSRRILFCLLAASSALIASPAIADPKIAQLQHHSGGPAARGFPTPGFHGGAKPAHGFHGGGKGSHARGRWHRRGPFYYFPDAWPADTLPYGRSEYPASVGASRVDVGDDRDRRDCNCGPFGYHPFGVQGHWPNGASHDRRAAPGYVLAPDARIISLDPND